MFTKKKSLLIIAFTSIFAGNVWAEKPDGKSHDDKHHKSHKEKRHDYEQSDHDDGDHNYRIEGESRYDNPAPNPYETVRQFLFNDQHRAQIRNYYYVQERSGHCPPGLAKKRNGCMPPGQAKKWSIGQQFPQSASYNYLPPELLYQLGQPPAGYGYVQSASDILMLNLATGVISDIIYNLGR